MSRKYGVTVICLAYNHEKYIEQTLKGFVAQKVNFPYRIIVHDDASTDGTADILESFAKRDKRMIKARKIKEAVAILSRFK